MNKKVLLTLLLALAALPAAAEKVAAFPEINKADQLVVDDEYIYVIEKVTVHAYSRKDYKLVRKFGKEGEGPREFATFVAIIPQKDHLLINSLNKISYYSKDGVFQKEIRSKGGMFNAVFYPLKNGFVGRGMVAEKNAGFFTVNLYDGQLNKIKEIYRSPTSLSDTGKLDLLNLNILYQTHENRIYVNGKGLAVDVFDADGNKLREIRQPYEPRKFTAEDERMFMDFLKSQFKAAFDQIKARIAFPAYFPEILGFFITDNLLYVITWKWENKKIECFIFELSGKLKKRIMIPLVFQNVLQPWPVAFKENKVYQLIENDETEEWELHVTPIK